MNKYRIVKVTTVLLKETIVEYHIQKRFRYLLFFHSWEYDHNNHSDVLGALYYYYNTLEEACEVMNKLNTLGQIIEVVDCEPHMIRCEEI